MCLGVHKNRILVKLILLNAGHFVGIKLNNFCFCFRASVETDQVVPAPSRGEVLGGCSHPGLQLPPYTCCVHSVTHMD